MSATFKTHMWISLWFLLTIPIILWDASFCFMRPRSFEGGDLHWIWKPYGLYQKIDFVYGLPAFESGDGFPNAQSFMNVIETALNIAYLYLAHVSHWPAAPLVGFGSALMTMSKTILYVMTEYYCNYCYVGHNSPSDLLYLWVLPSSFWIVVPALIVYRLGKDLADSLNCLVKGKLE